MGEVLLNIATTSFGFLVGVLTARVKWEALKRHDRVPYGSNQVAIDADEPVSGLSSMQSPRGERSGRSRRYDVPPTHGVEEWRCERLEVTRKGGEVVTLPGAIVFDETGNVGVLVGPLGALGVDDFEDNQSMTGETLDGREVRVAGALCTSTKNGEDGMFASFVASSAEIRTSDVQEWTTRMAYLPALRLRPGLQLSIGPRTYLLNSQTNQPREASDRLNATILTNVGTSTSVDVHDDEQEALTYLLSLAQRVLVHVARQDYMNDKGVTVAVRLTSSGSDRRRSSVAIPVSGGHLKRFLENGVSKYLALQSQYELKRLIGYYCLQHGIAYYEVRLALASMWMEAFKFYWALNVSGKGVIRKSNGLIRGFESGRVDRNNRPIASRFEELLNEACNHIGYSTTFTFIDDRNAIFHSGSPVATQLGGSAVSAIRPILTKLNGQIEDVFFTLLGYSGHVIRFGGARERFP